MTATITLSCPEGIVMATDKRCTIPKGFDDYDFKDNVNKIFAFSKIPIGISCWGLASFNSGTILDFLSKFESEKIVGNEDVNAVSEKLKTYVESNYSEVEIGMGFHIAGYCTNGKEKYPQIRHIFHGTWNGAGIFTNEDSNCEYHSLKDGTKTTFAYDPFIALFNGERAIANAFFAYLPKIYPKNTQIALVKLNLKQTIRLATIVINTSAEMLDFLYVYDHKIKPKAVAGLMVAQITPNEGFRMIVK